MNRIVCLFRGHRQYPGAPFYGHSHERCARCHRLLLTADFYAPSIRDRVERQLGRLGWWLVARYW